MTRKKTGVFTAALLAAAAVLCLLTSACGAGSGRTSIPESPRKTAETALREQLKDYIDGDTRIVWAEYDGLDEDVEAYEPSDLMVALSEEERTTYARSTLKEQHLLGEFTEALANRERKVCVIGMHTSILSGYDNDISMSYDGGVFRQLPYSTFWMKDYQASWGSAALEEGQPPERATIYSFEYYDLTDGQIEEMKADIDAETESVAACVAADADLWQKVRTVHDELVARLSYDESFGDHCHDLYGALVNHRTVCEGYALAFAHVLDRLGVRSSVIVSDWDEDTAVSHAWNQVAGYGNDCYIDVTWDDLGYVDPSGRPYVGYDYFGLTQEEMSAVEAHGNSDGAFWVDSAESMNYYRHEGCMLDRFDLGEVTEVLGRQYAGGANYLTVRFADGESFQEAKTALSDSETLSGLLGSLGGSEGGWYTFNDSVRTFSLGVGQYTVPEQ